MLRAELGLTFDDVVHNISYQNLMMLAHCAPNYDREDKQGTNTAPKSDFRREGKVTTIAKGGGADIMRSILAGNGMRH